MNELTGRKESYRVPADERNTLEPMSPPRLPTLKDSLATSAGRKLGKNMRMVAVKLVNGETPSEVAKAMNISTGLVREYLDAAIRCLNCQSFPINWSHRGRVAPNERYGKGRHSKPASKDLMTKSECGCCGQTIERDEDRLLLALLKLDYSCGEDDGWEEAILLNIKRGIHYCAECGRSMKEFTLPNPAYISEKQQREIDNSRDELKTQLRLEADAVDDALRAALAQGNIDKFDEAMPARPDPYDVMATAEQVEDVAERLARGRMRSSESGFPSTSAISNMTDCLMAGVVHGRASRPERGESLQRAKVLEYLNAAESRGKLLPEVRETARLWANGLGQMAIASKLGIEQSTVSRRIKAVLTKANLKT